MIWWRNSSAVPQRHERDRHLLQIGQVFLQVLQRVLDLQREQAAQAGAVFGRCHLGLVEQLNGHRVAQVHQRGKTDQGLAALAYFHQFRQLAKRPYGVFLARLHRRDCFIFCSYE